jgi:hypothetical protein
MTKRKVVQVFGNDGAGLYVNGKLASDWFTCAQGHILESLGYKKYISLQLDQKWYDHNPLPENLSDCVFKKIRI